MKVYNFCARESKTDGNMKEVKQDDQEV